MTQHFTDFSGNTVGSTPPLGWTRRWNAMPAPDGFRVSDSDPGAPVVPVAGFEGDLNVSTFDTLTWDAVGSVSGDVEIYCVFRASNGSATPGGLALCVSTSGINGYCAGPADGGTGIVLSILTAGVENFDVGAYSWTIDTDIAMRFRYESAANTLRVRAWLDGSSEPGTWTHSRNDATGFTSGEVGLFGRHHSGLRIWKKVGVGTGGDPAPTAPLGNAGPSSIIANIRRSIAG